MKICLIIPNESYYPVFKDMVGEYGKITFVRNAREFGAIKDLEWDVIVVDHHLPEMHGEFLIESIQNKTEAHLALIGMNGKIYNDKNVKNNRIRRLFQRYDHRKIIAWFDSIVLEKKLLKLIESTVL